MNNTILQYVSKRITQGHAVWEMLRINEYLDLNSPLRKALAFKATTSFNNSENSDAEIEVFNKIILGATLATLTETEKSIIMNRSEQRVATNSRKYDYKFVPSARFAAGNALQRSVRRVARG